MADHPGDPNLGVILKQLAALAPGFAGVLVSLGWAENMTIRGRLTLVVGGLACAWSMPPLIVKLVPTLWPPAATMTTEMAGVAGLLFGMLAMRALQSLATFLAAFFGDPFKLIKVSVGPVTMGGSINEPSTPPESGV